MEFQTSAWHFEQHTESNLNFFQPKSTWQHFSQHCNMYAYLFARYHPSETYICAFRVTSTNSHTNSQSSVRWHKAKKNPFIVDFKKSLIKIRSYAFTVFDSDRRQRARCHGKAPAIRLTRKSYRKFTKVVRLVVNFLTFTVSMIWILLHALLSAFCSKHFLLLNLCFLHSYLHSYLPVTAGNIFVFVWMRMNEIDAAGNLLLSVIHRTTELATCWIGWAKSHSKDITLFACLRCYNSLLMVNATNICW